MRLKRGKGGRCASTLLKHAYQESLCHQEHTTNTCTGQDDDNDRDVSLLIAPRNSPCFDVDAAAGVSLVQNFPDEAPHERARHVVLDGGKGGDGDGGILPLALPLVHFLFEEGVALLFHVEVDDAAELFLPDFEPVYVDVVADVSAEEGFRVWVERGMLGGKIKGKSLERFAEVVELLL